MGSEMCIRDSPYVDGGAASSWVITYNGPHIEPSDNSTAILSKFHAVRDDVRTIQQEVFAPRTKGQMIGLAISPSGKIHAHGVVVGRRNAKNTLRGWLDTAKDLVVSVPMNAFEPVRSVGAAVYAVRAKLERPKQPGERWEPELVFQILETILEYPHKLRFSQMYGCFYGKQP